jgi:hypothetical protein
MEQRLDDLVMLIIHFLMLIIHFLAKKMLIIHFVPLISGV